MRSKRKTMTMLKSPAEIPTFSTEREEAEFWQTHSPVEILDALPPANVKFVPVAKRLIPLPLDEKLYKELRRRARRQGVSALTLIQQLLEQSVGNSK